MPGQSFNVGGWRRTGAVRLRSSWFGFARAEEQWESRDGRREWRPVFLPFLLQPERR